MSTTQVKEVMDSMTSIINKYAVVINENSVVNQILDDRDKVARGLDSTKATYSCTKPKAKE